MHAQWALRSPSVRPIAPRCEGMHPSAVAAQSGVGLHQPPLAGREVHSQCIVGCMHVRKLRVAVWLQTTTLHCVRCLVSRMPPGRPLTAHAARRPEMPRAAGLPSTPNRTSTARNQQRLRRGIPPRMMRAAATCRWHAAISRRAREVAGHVQYPPYPVMGFRKHKDKWERFPRERMGLQGPQRPLVRRVPVGLGLGSESIGQSNSSALR